WFAEPGESDWLTTVSREVKAVRGGVGVCDVSTLGKIDIQGPDAGALLDRVYANTFSTLPVGKTRYGLMLREAGIVMDDGISARLFRVSFSGELAYELAVPARHGDAAIRAIMAAGAELGVVPYGTEALGVMRIEKGHVTGNELNGTTTAADLGLGRMMSTR